MKSRLILSLLALATLVIAAPVFAQSGGGYALQGMVTHGGGSALGGNFEMGGSAGQASGGVGSGGYVQTSGFWTIPLLNLVNNGDFNFPIGSSTLNWGTFADPANGITAQITGGVVEFVRASGSAQAVMLQDSGQPVPLEGGLRANFNMGNSSNVRKRVAVLLHDRDFSDIALCTFWMPPNAPMRTYQMLTHTTEAWTAAVMSVYASTADGIGWYRMDDVALQLEPTLNLNETRCTDPNAPTPPGGANGANMLTNGDFSGAFGNGTNSWATFGNVNAQITSGVLRVFRTAGDPAGSVLQNTSSSATTGMPLEVSLSMGSLTTERRRITILLHANNFSDLQACTFWIPPNAPLQTYTIQMFTTQAWGGVSLSFYPSNVVTTGAVTIDNVVYRQRPSLAVTGTGCYEPGSSPAAFDDAPRLMMPTLIPTATPLPLVPNFMPPELPLIGTLVPDVPPPGDEGTTTE
jgi:hypothetical protein